jgi:hypothetical protein
METLGAKLTKTEKQIFALEEGLTALARRLRQLEETVENSGLDGREYRPRVGRTPTGDPCHEGSARSIMVTPHRIMRIGTLFCYSSGDT